jgi:hypothetical protein
MRRTKIHLKLEEAIRAAGNVARFCEAIGCTRTIISVWRHKKVERGEFLMGINFRKKIEVLTKGKITVLDFLQKK